MLRQRTGAVVCPSCGKLVGVRDEVCYNCGRKNPGMWGFAGMLRKFGGDLPFTSLVTWGCIALYAASLLADPRRIGMNGAFGLSFLAPSSHSLFLFGASGAGPVFGYGRWWTLLSAGWLHGGLLHIVCNLLWVRQLAPATAELYGASRSVILYTAASAAGFLLSSVAGLFFGASMTIGASAPIFGLLGALVLYGRRTGSSHVSGQATSYAVILFLFGFIMPGIDNCAHLGGFLGGYAAARWLDPLRPEKADHLIGAAICLGLTALSVAASVLTVIRPG